MTKNRYRGYKSNFSVHSKNKVCLQIDKKERVCIIANPHPVFVGVI
jgi:hypothetical protein